MIGKLFLHDDGKPVVAEKATLILLADDQPMSSGSRGEDRSPESGESQGTSAGLTGHFFNPYRPVFGRGSLDRSSHSVFFGGLATIMVERSTLPPWGASEESR